MYDLPVVDLSTPEFHQNPFRTYKVLLEEKPLCRLAGGVYVVSRFQDVQKVLKQHDLFSSGWSQSAVIHPNWVKEDLKRDSFLTEMDPPSHTIHRAIVYPHLAKRKMKNLTPDMEDLARSLAHQSIPESKEIEFLDTFAFPYVTHFSDQITGLRTAEKFEKCRHWVEIAETFPVQRPSPEEKARIELELEEQNQYFDEIIEQKRAHPQRDLFSVLVNTEISGKQLGRHQLRGALNLFTMSGFEAPAQVIATALMMLANDKALNDLVRNDLGLIPDLIEETNRLYSPAQGSFRIAKTDVTMSCGVIPKGATVLALLGAANRDPRQFPDPDSFILQRDNIKTYVGFGGGNHLCVGVALARNEIRVALEVLLQIFSEIRCKPWDEQVWFSTMIGWLLRKVTMQFIR